MPLKNIEQRRAYDRQRYLVRREYCLAKSKEWRELNPNKVKENNHNDYLSHKQERIQSAIAWNKANPVKHQISQNIVSRRYYWRDPLYARMKSSAKHHGCFPNLLQQVLDRDMHQCQHCGTWDDLSFDHVIPVSKGGKAEYLNLQILCRPCNSRKGNRW